MAFRGQTETPTLLPWLVDHSSILNTREVAISNRIPATASLGIGLYETQLTSHRHSCFCSNTACHWLPILKLILQGYQSKQHHHQRWHLRFFLPYFVLYLSCVSLVLLTVFRETTHLCTVPSVNFPPMRLDPMHYSTHTLMVKEMQGLSGLGFCITSLIKPVVFIMLFVFTFGFCSLYLTISS